MDEHGFVKTLIDRSHLRLDEYSETVDVGFGLSQEDYVAMVERLMGIVHVMKMAFECKELEGGIDLYSLYSALEVLVAEQMVA